MDQAIGELPSPKGADAHFEDLDLVLKSVVNTLFADNPRYVVIYDSKLVHECAVRTAVSLGGYNMCGDPAEGGNGVQAPNHLKEAGHYAYWISRIKPLRLFNTKIVADILDNCGVIYDREALGALADDRRELIVKLNEWAAYGVANYIIVAAERKLLSVALDEITDPAFVTLIQQRYAQLVRYACIRSEDTAKEVMRSIRYDNHSANAMVFLMEGLFASGLFDHKCRLRLPMVSECSPPL